jgi:hypothetical protein
VAYTAGSPAQTSVAAFQTGGAEAMALALSIIGRVRSTAPTTAWNHALRTAVPGYQFDNDKDASFYVRAVKEHHMILDYKFQYEVLA